MTSSAETGGPTPQDLVDEIVGIGITVVPGTVTTTINAPTADPPNPASSPRAMGKFTGGLTPAGTLLPQVNQNANGDAEYAGGIGVASGVCLCTGIATDDDPQLLPQEVPQAGMGVGAEGPNNGWPLEQANYGEIDFDYEMPPDEDFTDLIPVTATDGDPTVLNFDIELQSPGILLIKYVHGTDEYPYWNLGLKNDTFLVLLRDPDCPNPESENFVVFRGRDPMGIVQEKTLSLTDLQDCGFLLTNLVAPEPSNWLAGTLHADFNRNGFVDAADLANPHFDHEFGGFSIPLTFESTSPLATSPLYRQALAPGVYNVKIVIQDVNDPIIDSAAFIETGSLKLFALHQGDYDGNGLVEMADYYVWQSHYGQSPAHFYDGDGSGNCHIGTEDYVLWYDNLSQTGNADLSADFNRDGCVDTVDWVIWEHNNHLTTCASRFQGDADGDGDVDTTDEDAWEAQYGNCSGGLLMQAASGDGPPQRPDGVESIAKIDNDDIAAARALKEQLPRSPDVDGDGDVDKYDLAVLNHIVVEAAKKHAAKLASKAEAGPQPEPTLAEPLPVAVPAIPADSLPTEDNVVPEEQSAPVPVPIQPEFPPVPPGPPVPPPGPTGPPVPPQGPPR